VALSTIRDQHAGAVRLGGGEICGYDTSGREGDLRRREKELVARGRFLYLLRNLRGLTSSGRGSEEDEHDSGRARSEHGTPPVEGPACEKPVTCTDTRSGAVTVAKYARWSVNTE
jgi:hypothetical protein